MSGARRGGGAGEGGGRREEYDDEKKKVWLCGGRGRACCVFQGLLLVLTCLTLGCFDGRSLLLFSSFIFRGSPCYLLVASHSAASSKMVRNGLHVASCPCHGPEPVASQPRLGWVSAHIPPPLTHPHPHPPMYTNRIAFICPHLAPSILVLPLFRFVASVAPFPPLSVVRSVCVHDRRRRHAPRRRSRSRAPNFCRSFILSALRSFVRSLLFFRSLFFAGFLRSLSFSNLRLYVLFHRPSLSLCPACCLSPISPWTIRSSCLPPHLSSPLPLCFSRPYHLHSQLNRDRAVLWRLLPLVHDRNDLFGPLGHRVRRPSLILHGLWFRPWPDIEGRDRSREHAPSPAGR